MKLFMIVTPSLDIDAQIFFFKDPFDDGSFQEAGRHIVGISPQCQGEAGLMETPPELLAELPVGLY
jgi:hypothetical protein